MQPRKGCVPLGERCAQVNAPCACRLTKKWHRPQCEDALPLPGVMVTGHGIFMHAQLAKSAALFVLLAGLTACAGADGRYPSLAMRPVETGAAAEAPAPPLPIRPATPAARLADLREAAAAAQTAFAARESEAARLARAAAGQPIESNARAAAMVALADLDAHRGKTAGALAALDTLAADAAAALSPDPALAALQGEVAATLARQDRTIAELWGVIGT